MIEDTLGYFNTGPVATLATTPERRIVLVNVREESEKFGRFCAEPAADVAESLSSSFQTALEAQLPQLDVGAAGELGRVLASAVQSLAQRSQGLQLYRAGSYRLCEMYLNDVIDKADYLVSMQRLLQLSVDLIDSELAKNAGKIGHGPVASLSAPQLQTLASLAQHLDAALPARPQPSAPSE